MEKAGLSCREMADRCRQYGVRCHWTDIWNYREGKRMPRADKVEAIRKASGGKVTSKDLSIE